MPMEKTEFIHMRANPGLKKRVERAAKKRYMSMSQWIVEAILNQLHIESSVTDDK
jgi:uncharacterized protein (DUF1778 family)